MNSYVSIHFTLSNEDNDDFNNLKNIIDGTIEKRKCKVLKNFGGYKVKIYGKKHFTKNEREEIVRQIIIKIKTYNKDIPITNINHANYITLRGKERNKIYKSYGISHCVSNLE